jgi:acyl-CoA synthetase (AMP-forming)/AMP-acid ligase II
MRWPTPSCATTWRVDEQLTRAALNARVRSLLAALRPHAQAGDAVLLVYPPGLDFACAFWACVLAGAVPVPVSSLDARLRTGLNRLRAIADDARPVWCCATNARSRWCGLKAARQGTKHGLQPTPCPITEPCSARRGRRPRTTAYLQYTSGSTSTPRGVMVTHAAALANCRGLSAALLPDDHSKVPSWLPHFHDYGLVHGIVWPLFAGIPAYLMSPITFLRRPLRWLEAIECLGISHSGAPNFAYAACLAALDNRPDWQADLRCWQHASCGAEPIRANVAQEFSARLAPHGFHECAFAPAYGLAEATLLVSVKRRDEQARVVWSTGTRSSGSVRLSDALGPQRARWCDAALRSRAEVRVVDPDTAHLRPTPSANSGSGAVRSAQATWADPMRARPVRPGARRRLTCAMVAHRRPRFLHDGQVVVTGRLKDLLIISGRNIAPQDVESTAERAADGLRVGYGAVFSIDGADGERAVVLQEVERRSQSADLPALAAAIRVAVASEHELPLHSVVLLKPGVLARTSSGKIQRNRCRDDYLQQRLEVLFEDRAAVPDCATTGGLLASLLQAAQRIAGASSRCTGAQCGGKRPRFATVLSPHRVGAGASVSRLPRCSASSRYRRWHRTSMQRAAPVRRPVASPSRRSVDRKGSSR